MLSAPWICRGCAHLLQRTIAFRKRFIPPQSRAASSSNTTESSTPNALAPTNIPPALLARARALAAEHAALQSSLATNFTSHAARRAGELATTAELLSDLDSTQTLLFDLQRLATADPDADLRALARDDAAATAARLAHLARRLTASLTPRHPFADMPCLMEFRLGSGGIEGRYFAHRLLRMYQGYCARVGLATRVVKYETAEGAGVGMDGEEAVQDAVLEIAEPGAYERFRTEAGVHRVQRVPATEKNGRTHTSVVGLWVLPSFLADGAKGAGSGGPGDFDDLESDFYIDPAEVRTETMRARGAGGQHVNKTESAVRLTHIPTGTTVSMQDSRSQHRNRDSAWRLLRSKLAQQRRDAREEQVRQLRRNVLADNDIAQVDKIRTYNFNQNRVSDHRSGLDVHNLLDVLEGGPKLDELMESVREWLINRDIRALIAEENAQEAQKAKEAKQK